MNAKKALALVAAVVGVTMVAERADAARSVTGTLSPKQIKKHIQAHFRGSQVRGIQYRSQSGKYRPLRMRGGDMPADVRLVDTHRAGGGLYKGFLRGEFRVLIRHFAATNRGMHQKQSTEYIRMNLSQSPSMRLGTRVLTHVND